MPTKTNKKMLINKQQISKRFMKHKLLRNVTKFRNSRKKKICRTINSMNGGAIHIHKLDDKFCQKVDNFSRALDTRDNNIHSKIYILKQLEELIIKIKTLLDSVIISKENPTIKLTNNPTINHLLTTYLGENTSKIVEMFNAESPNLTKNIYEYIIKELKKHFLKFKKDIKNIYNNDTPLWDNKYEWFVVYINDVLQPPLPTIQTIDNTYYNISKLIEISELIQDHDDTDKCGDLKYVLKTNTNYDIKLGFLRKKLPIDKLLSQAKKSNMFGFMPTFRALRILNADFSTLKNTKCFYSFKSF